MDLTSSDFGLDQMMLKKNIVVEVDMGEPEKAKPVSGRPKTMEVAGVSENVQPGQAAMEVGQRKVEDQSGKANAGTEGAEAETGTMEAEAA